MSVQIHHLVTYHGTLVYLDVDTIRTGPIATSPRNLVLVREERDGWLALRTADGLVAVDRFAAGSIRYSGDPDPAAIPLTIRPRDGGMISLKLNGFYVAAEGNGLLTLNRPYYELWEMFLPLSDAELRDITHLLTSEWYSYSQDRVLRPSDIRLGERFQVSIGSIEKDVVELLAAIDAAPDPQRELSFVYDRWKMERMRLFRPLIYFGAFGKQAIFDCMTVSMTSMREFGRYRGEFAVLSDRPPEELRPYVVPGDPLPVTATTAATDPLDFMAARFRIAQHERFAAYQPILYADTDLICDTPIEPLLTAILRSDRFCVCEEKAITEECWYGWPLFQQDASAVPKTRMGFTTGVMGWPDMATVGSLFDMVLAVIYAQADRIGNRVSWDCFDQPVANYVVNKAFSFDDTVLRNAALLPHLHHLAGSVERLGGFLHFCGHVGGGQFKIDGMRDCLSSLRDRAGARGEQQD